MLYQNKKEETFIDTYKRRSILFEVVK